MADDPYQKCIRLCRDLGYIDAAKQIEIRWGNNERFIPKSSIQQDYQPTEEEILEQAADSAIWDLCSAVERCNTRESAMYLVKTLLERLLLTINAMEQSNGKR